MCKIHEKDELRIMSIQLFGQSVAKSDLYFHNKIILKIVVYLFDITFIYLSSLTVFMLRHLINPVS